MEYKRIDLEPNDTIECSRLPLRFCDIYRLPSPKFQSPTTIYQNVDALTCVDSTMSSRKFKVSVMTETDDTKTEVGKQNFSSRYYGRITGPTVDGAQRLFFCPKILVIDQKSQNLEKRAHFNVQLPEVTKEHEKSGTTTQNARDRHQQFNDWRLSAVNIKSLHLLVERIHADSRTSVFEGLQRENDGNEIGRISLLSVYVKLHDDLPFPILNNRSAVFQKLRLHSPTRKHLHSFFAKLFNR